MIELKRRRKLGGVRSCTSHAKTSPVCTQLCYDEQKPYLSLPEYAYIVRYCQRSVDPRLGRWSWRIRQSALYHRYDTRQQASVYFIFNPGETTIAETACRQKLVDMHQRCLGSAEQANHFALDEIMLGVYLEGWGTYVRDFERRLTDVVGPWNTIVTWSNRAN